MTKYGGKSKASDWSCKRVKLTRECRNGYAIFPAGTVGTLSNEIREGNISFATDKCECCGITVFISGLSYRDFIEVERS